jgi:hypothetical protein
MKTTINKVAAYAPEVAERLQSVFGDADQEFDLVDLVAHSKGSVSDALQLLGEAGKSALCIEFATFCAVTMEVKTDLEYEIIALYNPKLGKTTLRSIANGMKEVGPVSDTDRSLVWRKRRAVQKALLARASRDPVHVALYAAHAYTWSYQVNARGLKEKLIELLLEDK